MGTEVLRPQGCLNERIRVSPAVFPRRRSCNYGNSYSNPRPNRKQQAARTEKPDRRRRAASAPAISKRSISDDLRAASGSGLVMEKVAILRRGESLDSKLISEAGVRKEGVGSVPGQVRAAEFRSPVACGRSDVYAGSAFFVSPEPSSLPLPSFSKKKLSPIDDCATRDLRRLLRLD